MRYSDFIKNTISHQNGIEWNYYNSDMHPESILLANTSNRFIHDYFHNGCKELPLLLDPVESTNFLQSYFVAGCKESILALGTDNRYALPDERAVHTVSGFFLGLLIENCLNGQRTLSIEFPYWFPFSYFWFLTFLYHDYGYCVAEKEDSPITVPKHAPKPTPVPPHQSSRARPQEYYSLHQVKRSLGITLSPFSSFPGPFSSIGLSRRNNEISIVTALLRELTQRAYSIEGRPRIRFSTGAEIRGHQYNSAVVTRYFNYCINERSRLDHGIIGGYLFYDRIVKNYLSAYLSSQHESNETLALSNFYYKGKHFCSDQLPLFSYVTDCIMAHNIWRQSEETKELYKEYLLDTFLGDSYKAVTFSSNPLLYILVLADTLEPTKVYYDLPAQEISEAIEIEYSPGSHTITFSSQSAVIDIKTLHRKAKGLEDWTSVRCSELNCGKFTLHI